MSRAATRRVSRPPARRRGTWLTRFLASPLWKEVRTLALLAFGALLLVSLLTYHPGDPAPIFGTEGGVPDTRNAAGPVGAFLAAASFQMVGVAAYLLPVLTLFLGLNRWAPFGEDWHASRTLGTALLLWAATGLLHLWFAPAGPLSSPSPGGMLGAVTGSWLAARLHGVGASIVLVSLLALSLLFTTRLTLQSAVSHTVRTATAAFTWSRSGFAALVVLGQQWNRRSRSSRRGAGRPRSRRPVSPPVVNQAGDDGGAGAPGPDTAPEPSPALPPVEPVAAAPRARESRAADQPSSGDRPDSFILPSLSLLNQPDVEHPVDEQELVETARLLTSKLREFDMGGSVTAIHPGPVITTFEFKPDAGIKYSRITNLVDDLSLAMKAESVRIERLAGRATIGIEVPNRHRELIPIRDLLDSDVFRTARGGLPLAIGKTIDGQPYATELEKMPHLLIAGATGTGKSVALNAMITSILFRATPAEVKFIFIDPKMLELGVYEDLPHLICPVVTDASRAARALRWATLEMTRRYAMLFGHGVRNVEQYNRMVRGASAEEPATDEKGEPLQPLAYIVIVIDELADLMMVSSKEVEAAVQRLAQMARAVGIHLIVTTQRPSVDVLTGVIKANFPCRIAFRVSSRTDSNVILDRKGAERLLGLGDMLFLPPGASRLVRIHGALVEEAEVRRITAFLRRQARPVYNDEVLKEEEEGTGPGGMAALRRDELYEQAARLVVTMGQASVPNLQRRLSLGYARAARLMDALEAEGIVGPPEGSKPRQILVPPDYFEQLEDRPG